MQINFKEDKAVLDDMAKKFNDPKTTATERYACLKVIEQTGQGLMKFVDAHQEPYRKAMIKDAMSKL